MKSSASAEPHSVIRCNVDVEHSLGLRVTTEGFEDCSAWTCLRGLGCDEAQGYFTSWPVPPEELDASARSRPVSGEVKSLQVLHAL